MKKLILLLLLLSCLFSSNTSNAQISYNGVILNTDESLLKDESVTLRIKIRENDPGGNSVFEEEHDTTTNKYGIFFIIIGEGNGNDDFSIINWGKGDYYVETALKTNSDSSFRVLGVTKLAYAPLALYAKNAGVFKTENGATSNKNGNIGSDDFVFGSTQLDNVDGTNDGDVRMFFDKSKGAFRTGHVSNNNWDEDSLGIYSFATGSEVLASGNNSTAIGWNTKATGNLSFSLGYDSHSIGLGSFTLGRGLTSNTREQVSIGAYNVMRAGQSEIWSESNPLFVIGNGIGDTESERSDALVMLKNGNTELNGAFTIDVSNDDTGYTLPTQKGTENQVLTANADGTTSWKDASNGTAETIYTVGLNKELGGYVVYVTPNGKHGLVVPMIDNEIDFVSNKTTWYGAQDMISRPHEKDEDARNFTDCRLPTAYEMETYMVPKATELNLLSFREYWTSTETSSSTVYSFTGTLKRSRSKTFNFYVRAVRSF